MKKRLPGIVLLCLLLAVAGAIVPALAVTATAAPAVNAGSSSAVLPVPPLPDGEKRYIVKYGSGADAEAESDSLKQKGIEVKDTFSHTMKASVVVATPSEIASVQASGRAASIEPDTRVSISGATSIWGLDRVDQRTGRDGQYPLEDEGAGVNIYVADTGLNMSHTEFTNRIIASWTGINDGKGVNDCNGHGTHTTGTAAGTTYGIAKKANIIPVRVVECDGTGWNSTAIAGIDWAVAHHVAGQPAVMNMSIGGFASDSFDQAVQSAINDGITVVAAAGNDGVDACNASPARIPAAITVAATDINDNQASWSDYGSCVDIQAPGVSIRSAWNNSPTGYNTLSGTSMATPHVSGAAAILLSRNRAMSPADVQQTMINNASLNVVGANKGSTPNRFLYIPGMPPPPPNCGALKPGDAWAGVSLYCGLGKTASILSDGGAAPAPSTDAPVTTTAADTAGSALGLQEPEPAPAGQPDPAPADSTVEQPASAPQAPAAAQPAPESGNGPQATPSEPVLAAANNKGFGQVEAAATHALPAETADSTEASAVGRGPAARAGTNQPASNAGSVALAIAAGFAFCALVLLRPIRKRSLRRTASGETSSPS
ncbi:MAG: S8 family serine peptidase [Arthrobacter sp.]